jgi:3-dehydroquinate synthase
VKKKNKVFFQIVEQQTEVIFENSLRTLAHLFSEENIILVDSKLKKNITRLKSSKALVVYLKGSESTKSLSVLVATLNKVFSNKKFELNKKTKIVVIGGGTLGDFGGFLAHILKRGLPLIMVPSTWLSAIDSAHGGKNGINFKRNKNQLGTVYPAQKVILVRDLLEQQPPDRTVEGFGELVKIGYLRSPGFYKRVCKEKLSTLDLFSYLPKAIEAKYYIVKKDPFETRGIRYLLNFGHTIGHVWEARLGIHHGISVLLGIYFDFLWASHLGYPVEKDIEIFYSSEIVRGVLALFYHESLFSISSSDLKSTLAADKKKESKYVRYIFPHRPGQLKIVSVTVDDIWVEYQRQKKLIGQNRDFAFVEV